MTELDHRPDFRSQVELMLPALRKQAQFLDAKEKLVREELTRIQNQKSRLNDLLTKYQPKGASHGS